MWHDLIAIDPDEIKAWVILTCSVATTVGATVTLGYSRVLKTRLEAEAMAAIHRANLDAIAAGREAPYPGFLPVSAAAARAPSAPPTS